MACIGNDIQSDDELNNHSAHALNACVVTGWLRNAETKEGAHRCRCNVAISLGLKTAAIPKESLDQSASPAVSSSQPKRLDSIMHGVVPFDMLQDCHGAAMFLQSSIFTLGLASSLAASSNYSEDLLFSFPPPESIDRTHGHTTAAVYAFFAF